MTISKISRILSLTFVLILIQSISYSQIRMDNGEIFVESGTYTDPNGFNDYVDSGLYYIQTLCSEVMQQNAAGEWVNSMINFNFTEFALGLGDTLYIYDGDNTNGPLIGMYNGVNSPGAFISPSSCVTFVFVTDGVVDLLGMNAGWRANFAPYFPDPDNVLLNSPMVLKTTCNSKFYDSGGATSNFTAPGTTGQVAIFTAAAGQHIKAEINSFNIGSNCMMEIFDGNLLIDPNARRIGYFKNGFAPPAELISSSVWMSFKLTGTGTGAGWDIDISCVSEIYEQPEGASGCPEVSIGRFEVGTDFEAIDEFSFDCNNPLVMLQAQVSAPGLLTNDYTVQSIPCVPPFPYHGGGMTSVPASTDDSWLPGVNLPSGFSFTYYGNSYNQLWPGTNGAISFSSRSGGETWSFSMQIPNAPTFDFVNGSDHKNSIFGVYQDTYPGAGSPPQYSGVYYGQLGSWPCRTFVMSFYRLPQFSCTSDNLSTYQMVLYEGSNIIDIYIQQRTVCASWNGGNGLAGILNASGNMAVVPPGRNTGPWTAQNEAWRFIPITPTNYTIKWYQNSAIPANEITNNNRDKRIISVFPTQTTRYIVEMSFETASGQNYTLYDTVLIRVDRPELRISATPNSICPGEESVITVTTADPTLANRLHSFSWNTGNPNDNTSSITVNPNITSGYTVQVTYDNNCQNSISDTVLVTEMEWPKIIGDTLICKGEQVTLTATNAQGSIRWSTGEAIASIHVSPSQTTEYRVSVTSPIGCVTTDTFTVQVNPAPTVAFAPNPQHVYVEDGQGTINFVNFSTDVTNYHWNFGDKYCISGDNTSSLSDPSHIYTRSGRYNVILTGSTEAGCTDSVSTTVVVEVPYFYYIPNSFTPNNDGINDIFYTSGEGLDPDNFEMLIYDRYGHLVFKTTTPFDYWDGKDRKGKMCNEGEYIYKITALDMEGIPKVYTNTIMLIR